MTSTTGPGVSAPEPAVRAEDRPPAPPAARQVGRHPVVITGLVVAGLVLAAQLTLLLLRSWHQYQQFDVSMDFGIFHQAWHQIAHGHLSPQLTDNPIVPVAAPYWRSHFELIMWPLALLYWIAPNDGLTLLVIQDLAIVGAEVVMVWWMVQLAQARRRRAGLVAVLVVAAAVLGAADPWLYVTALWDFHLEPVGAFFALVAAWQLWAGHTRRCWVFVVLALLCGDVPATYIIGAGVAVAIATPRVRRQAVLVAGSGLAWLVLIAALGANQGSQVQLYAYLASHQPLPAGAGGLAAIGQGMLAHPSRPLHQFAASRHNIWRLLAPTGLLGVVSPWMWAAALMVLAENVLNANPIFQAPNFQNAPVYLFATAGTGLLLVAAAGRGVLRQALCCVLLVAAVVPSLWFDHGNWPRPSFPPAAAGQQLQQVRDRVPPDAEVISSFGVMGRFAGRSSIHTFVGGGNTVPIDEPVVVVVIARGVGNDPTPPAVDDALQGAMLRNGASTIAAGPVISAYEWRPGPGVRSLRIPG